MFKIKGYVYISRKNEKYYVILKDKIAKEYTKISISIKMRLIATIGVHSFIRAFNTHSFIPDSK